MRLSLVVVSLFSLVTTTYANPAVYHYYCCSYSDPSDPGTRYGCRHMYRKAYYKGHRNVRCITSF